MYVRSPNRYITWDRSFSGDVYARFLPASTGSAVAGASHGLPLGAHLLIRRPPRLNLVGRLRDPLGRNAYGLHRPADDRAGLVAFYDALFRDGGASKDPLSVSLSRARHDQCPALDHPNHESLAWTVYRNASPREK